MAIFPHSETFYNLVTDTNKVAKMFEANNTKFLLWTAFLISSVILEKVPAEYPPADCLYAKKTDIEKTDLSSFTAVAYHSAVLLRWKTASELDNDGFNIYRSPALNGSYHRINTTLIPGLGSSTTGREYSFLDSSVTPGTNYCYKLEHVKFDGKATSHGPVEAHTGLDSDGDGMTDDWEYFYGLNEAQPADAATDLDSDGFSNHEEYVAGADPAVDQTRPGEPYPAKLRRPLRLKEFSPRGAKAPVRIIEENESCTSLELNTTGFVIENTIECKEGFQLLSIPGYVHGYTAGKGRPMLPLKSVLIGIPPGAFCKLEGLDYEVEVFSGYRISPVPKVEGEQKGSERPADPRKEPKASKIEKRFDIDENLYSTGAFYPHKIVRLAGTTSLRSQRVLRIDFLPLQFNPVEGKIRLYRSIRVKIAFHRTDSSRPEWNENPPLDNPSLKIVLKQEGIYRLSCNELHNAGLQEVPWADPRTIKVYNHGKEVPIRVEGEKDGSFDYDDQVVFYASSIHSKYTNKNVYWLTYGGREGLRMEETTLPPPEGETPVVVKVFPATVHYEEDAYYRAQLKGPGELDHWFFSESIWGGSEVDFHIQLPHLVSNPPLKASVRLNLPGFFDLTPYPNHHVEVYLNGHLIDEARWSGAASRLIEEKVNQAKLFEGANTLTVKALLGPGLKHDLILADWFELEYWRRLTLDRGVLKFTYEGHGLHRFSISGFTGSDLEIYDITREHTVKYLPDFSVHGDSISFFDRLAGEKEYIILTKEKGAKPLQMTLDRPSELRSKENQADYVVITPKEFYYDILPLAEFRQEDGLNVKVLNVEDIYDEFSYGIQTPYAIKDFLRFAYENWRKPAPLYVLLVGDASYDYKDNLRYGNTNYVPSYLLWTPRMGETGSDNWFVCVDGPHDVLPDMFVGRIPARTREEVRTVVSKTLSYEKMRQPGPSTGWLKNVILVADNEPQFERTSDELAELLPDEYRSRKIYLSSYINAGRCKEQIESELSKGALLVCYMGHAGVQLWANEGILDSAAASSLRNSFRLPLVVSLTCLDGYYLHPHHYPCLAETFLTEAGGGAVACFSPTGMGLPRGHGILAKKFFESLFNYDNPTLGSATTQAKVDLYALTGKGYKDLIQTYHLFGDPALELKSKKSVLTERKGAEGRSGKGVEEETRSRREGLGTGFENIYRKTVANYEFAKRWREGLEKAGKPPGLSKPLQDINARAVQNRASPPPERNAGGEARGVRDNHSATKPFHTEHKPRRRRVRRLGKRQDETGNDTREHQISDGAGPEPPAMKSGAEPITRIEKGRNLSRKGGWLRILEALKTIFPKIRFCPANAHRS